MLIDVISLPLALVEKVRWSLRLMEVVHGNTGYRTFFKREKVT